MGKSVDSVFCAKKYVVEAANIKDTYFCIMQSIDDSNGLYCERRHTRFECYSSIFKSLWIALNENFFLNIN